MAGAPHFRAGIRNPDNRRSPSAPRFQRQDRRGDVRQIIVELMIATRQVVHAGPWNRACVEVGMRGRNDVHPRNSDSTPTVSSSNTWLSKSEK